MMSVMHKILVTAPSCGDEVSRVHTTLYGLRAEADAPGRRYGLRRIFPAVQKIAKLVIQRHAGTV